MSFLWEGVKQMSAMAGAAALLAGQKTKLRGEIMLVEREVKTRQQTFGVELYDFVAPLARSPDFFAANDRMTDVIRGPFLAAQREIAALMIKRGKLKEELAQAEVARKAAFPAPATTFGEQVLNTGKATAFTANEVKIKTEIGMVDTQIRAHKEDFGENMFDTLVKLEDEQGWLPTVRDIRTMYDKARQDVDKLKVKADTKEREIATLGTEGDVAASNFSTTATATPGGMTTAYGSSSSSSSNNALTSTSAHSRPSPLGPQLVVAPAPISAPAPALALDSNSSHRSHTSGGGGGGGGMFGSASPGYGATPAPASHGAPPPAAASYGSHGTSAQYVDPFGASPPPLGGSAPAANVASGLFLGLAGDGGTGSGSSSNVMGASSAMGTSYGIRKAPPRAHAGPSSSSGPTSTFPDPFAAVPSGSGPAVVDPFAPQPQPQQYSMDPFGSAAQPPLSAASTGVPNDPFSFTQPSLAAASSSTAPALPYDPFKSNFGGGGSSSSSKQDDDPFADLVASGQR